MSAIEKLPEAGQVSRLPQVSETASMIAAVERLARDPSIPMERIQGMYEMLRDMRREQAEEAFNEAMSVAQRDMTAIARDSFNPQTKSKYASYHAIDNAIRPIYTANGIGVSFDEGDGAPENHIRVLAFVSKGRHTRTYHYDSPIITQGMKGGTMMTLTHARASAVTYARRYLVGMIFNLSTGEDDDGNAAGTPVQYITQEQADAIRDLIEAEGKSLPTFLKWAKVESIEELRADIYESCIAAIKYKAPAK